MNIIYSRQFLDDALSALDYIENNLSNPSASESLKKNLFENIDRLKDSPYLGESLPSVLCIDDSDLRRLVVKNYILVYEVSESTVIIQRLFYGGQDWKSILGNQNL